MIPVVVFWTQYTTTMQGRTLKSVSCEDCSTEYLYVMERESSGVGTSVYLLNPDAADHSQSAAAETLDSVLDNDFDPVPCPACGHYQRFMFPKLMETKSIGALAIKVVIVVIGSVAAVIGANDSIAYLQRPNEHLFKNVITAWSVFLLACLIGLGLSIINRAKMRRFDPNSGDREARIALGRSRAVTRQEFERVQQEMKSAQPGIEGHS